MGWRSFTSGSGASQDAVSAAKDQIKRNPNDIEAHTLLGQVYLRSLGDMTRSAVAARRWQLAIAEYETIATAEAQRY